MSKKITLLGSTGSIGTQSLDVIRAQGYEVFGLSAHSHVDKILEQVEEFHPKYVCMTNPEAAAKLDAALSGRANAPKLLVGPEGLKELAAMDGTDVVLNSVVGIAGLGASLTAIESGHDLALANKESLVTGGHLVTQAVAKHGVKLLPVDSEHSAIFQCLQDKESAKSLTKILLTASGGPFFGMKTEELRGKTKADALKHPNWNMGAKITIDSATLMNKGLELIEAVWLFGLPPEKIQIVVQRQSIVHSAVQYSDNDIDLLARGGVTPLESAGGVISPVRGITTRTTTGGAADATWRELTTVLTVDDVIPAVRAALRSKFARAKNTAQGRSAIRSQVIVELEKKLAAQIIESYGDVTVSASAEDPTVCVVEFGFAVAHGLNQIYLTVHITV